MHALFEAENLPCGRVRLLKDGNNHRNAVGRKADAVKVLRATSRDVGNECGDLIVCTRLSGTCTSEPIGSWFDERLVRGCGEEREEALHVKTCGVRRACDTQKSRLALLRDTEAKA
jgi:hypothetical protein